MNLRIERSKAAAIERRKKAESITPEEREAGRQAYADYVKRCQRAGASFESFNTFLGDWIDEHRRGPEPAVDDQSWRTARDYGAVLYNGGRGGRW